MIAAIPRLETPRLLLRPFGASDLDDLAAMLGDPVVMRFLGDGVPRDRADSWRQLTSILGHWALRGFGLWALERREDGAFLGWAGHLQHEGWPGFELAYSLAPSHWGQGYAREAAATALGYAQETLQRETVISIIRPDNARSIRVATALGAVRDRTVTFLGAEAEIYRYPAPANR
ncbi:MAG: GNAT family N-acetyltransferase [Gemmatimonadetes bacterium]|nr:GNAT family N-acetyltransferase [Gemmatimonadota bacterium]